MYPLLLRAQLKGGSIPFTTACTEFEFDLFGDALYKLGLLPPNTAGALLLKSSLIHTEEKHGSYRRKVQYKPT